MEEYIRSKIDMGDIYINNLYNFYDIKIIVSKMKSKSPAFEDVLVEIGNIVMGKDYQRKDKLSIDTKLEEVVRKEFDSLFMSNAYKFKEMDINTFKKIISNEEN